MKITINVNEGAPASFDFKAGKHNSWAQLSFEEQLLALRTFAAAHEAFSKFLKRDEE